LHSLISPL